MLQIKHKSVAAFVKMATVGTLLMAPNVAFASDDSEATKPKKGCLGTVGFDCQVRADNDSTTIEATQPASFAYTLNDEKKDSVAVQASLTFLKPVGALKLSDKGDTFWTLKALWHKNNQQDKKQNNLKFGTGLQFEFRSQRAADPGGPIIDIDTLDHYWSVYVDTDLAYNRKATYGDEKDSICIADPTLKACGTQHVETLRLSLVAAPFNTRFEHWGGEVGDLYMVAVPKVGLFYDDALNGNVETLDGTDVNGSVFGGFIGGTYTVSPGVFKNKWSVSVSGQLIESFDRSSGRTTDFKKTSRLFSVSLDHALAGTYTGEKAENKWLPSIGVTYSKGSDTLKGRESLESAVLGLKIKY